MGMRNLGLLFIVLAFTGLAEAKRVDDFESYALDTVLEGVGGWATFSGQGSNLGSPIVNDSTSGYSEFNGQFMRLIDDNSNGLLGEMVVKDSFSILYEPDEYVQVAMYMSSETVGGDEPSAGLECRVLEGGGVMLRFGVSWDYRTDNLAHWFYYDGTDHHTNFPDQINNPSSRN